MCNIYKKHVALFAIFMAITFSVFAQTYTDTIRHEYILVACLEKDSRQINLLPSDHYEEASRQDWASIYIPADCTWKRTTSASPNATGKARSVAAVYPAIQAALYRCKVSN